MNQPIIYGGWKKSSTTHASAQSLTSIIKPGTVNTANEHFIPDNVPVFYQELSDCVANATCAAFMLVRSLQADPVDKVLSRRFLYWNARSYSNDTGHDAGSYIHLALQSIERLGVCSEDICPYEPSKVLQKPNYTSYREADSNHIETFYQITSQGDQKVIDVCLAIQSGHPVILGTQVGPDLMNYQGEDKVFEFPTSSVGGHAVHITGYADMGNGKKKFKIKNSWSSSWGMGGSFYMSEDYLKRSETSDLFVPTLVPNLSI